MQYYVPQQDVESFTKVSLSQSTIHEHHVHPIRTLKFNWQNCVNQPQWNSTHFSLWTLKIHNANTNNVTVPSELRNSSLSLQTGISHQAYIHLNCNPTAFNVYSQCQKCFSQKCNWKSGMKMMRPEGLSFNSIAHDPLLL